MDKFEIITKHVKARGRGLDQTWTYRDWEPPNPLRWYHRLWVWVHHLFGYASPYCTSFHGIDIESEIAKELVKEIVRDRP